MDRPKRTVKKRLFPDSENEIITPPRKLSKTERKKRENVKYKEKLKSDPIRHAEHKANDAARKRAERKRMTKEEKVSTREKTRLRNIAYRERQRAKKATKTPSSIPTPRNTRADAKKMAERKEKNRLSQAKRRANMHPQKKRREKEKNRLYYNAHRHTSKNVTPCYISKPCAQSTPDPSSRLHCMSDASTSLAPATLHIPAADTMDSSASLAPTALGIDTDPSTSLPPTALGTDTSASLEPTVLSTDPSASLAPTVLSTDPSVSLPPTALSTDPFVSLALVAPTALGMDPSASLATTALSTDLSSSMVSTALSTDSSAPLAPMALSTDPSASLAPTAHGRNPSASLLPTALATNPFTSLAPTTFHASDTPAAPVKTFKKVSRSTLYRIKKKFKDRMPIVMKGLVKNFDKKNSKTLSECGISYTSPSKSATRKHKNKNVNRSTMIPGNKRDKKTLSAKRALKGVTTSPYKRSSNNGKYGQLIQNFYESKSIHVPGKKVVGSDLVSKKTLDKSIVNLHQDFILENGPLVSRATFFRYRPNNVLSFTKTPFRQCLCEICLNPMLKVKVLKRLITVGVDSLKQLINLTLCDGGKFQCFERKCKDCGVDEIEKWIDMVDREKIVSWQKWEKVSKNGANRIDLVKKEGKIFDLVNELKADVLRLPMHDFIHRWQSAQYRHVCNELPQDWACVTLDFAENYLCKQQDQPQSAYFGYTQVTVHPCVIYRWCSCGIRKTENWTFLSDNLSHSADMVNTIVRQILCHLKSLEIKKVVIFSDGCSSQYKSKLPFHHLFSYAFHFDLAIERCFFGARHGKNPCDALGGVLKQAASRAVKARKCIIQNAEDLHKFALENLSVCASDCRQHMSRDFFVLKDEDLLNSDGVQLKTLPGTRTLHSLMPTRQGLLVRNLTCFCEFCTAGQYAQCSNGSTYVKAWRLVPMSGAQEFTSLNSSSISIETEHNADEAFLEDPEQDAQSPSDMSPLTLSRESFFLDLQTLFSLCSSFEELMTAVKEASPGLRHFSLPEISFRTVRSISGCIDKVAKGLYDITGMSKHLYPVLTVADGNCVPRALSILCFGDESHHVELRCRIVVELVSNCQDYLCLNENDLTILCQLSDFHSGNAEKTFQQEVLHVCKTSTYMGIWQIMAAANALGVDILSVYPPLGPQLYKSFCSRTLPAKNKVSCHIYALFWSSTVEHSEDMPREYWTANHVVPLLPISEPTLVEMG